MQIIGFRLRIPLSLLQIPLLRLPYSCLNQMEYESVYPAPLDVHGIVESGTCACGKLVIQQLEGNNCLRCNDCKEQLYCSKSCLLFCSKEHRKRCTPPVQENRVRVPYGEWIGLGSR